MSSRRGPSVISCARVQLLTLDRAVIARGLQRLGRARSHASGFVHKPERGQPVTVAIIGASIAANSGCLLRVALTVLPKTSSGGHLFKVRDVLLYTEASPCDHPMVTRSGGQRQGYPRGTQPFGFVAAEPRANSKDV